MPLTTAYTKRVCETNVTREPKLAGPQPTASSLDVADEQAKAAPPGQPVPTQSFVSKVDVHVSIVRLKPSGLRGGCIKM